MGEILKPKRVPSSKAKFRASMLSQRVDLVAFALPMNTFGNNTAIPLGPSGWDVLAFEASHLLVVTDRQVHGSGWLFK